MACADALEGALADPSRRGVRIVTDDTCAQACVALAREFVAQQLHGRRGYLSQMPGAGAAPWAARALELIAWHGAHRRVEPSLAPVDMGAAEVARRGGVAGFARVIGALEVSSGVMPPVVVIAPIREIDPALRSEIDQLVTASAQRTRTQIVLIERVPEGAAISAMGAPLSVVDARAPTGTAVRMLGAQMERTADALERGPSRRTIGGAGPASAARTPGRPLTGVCAPTAFVLGDEGRAVTASSLRAMSECLRGDPAAALRRQHDVVARCLAAGATGEAASQQLHVVAFASAAGVPAMEHARRAVDLADRSEDPRHAVTSRLALAAVVLAQGEDVEAGRWYREAAERAVAISEPVLAIEAHRCAGELALEHGLQRVGIEQLEHAVALAAALEPEARWVSGAIESARRLADALGRAGLHERARACRVVIDQWAAPRRTA